MRAAHSVNLGIGSYRTETDFETVNWTVAGVDAPDMSTNYRGFELEYVNRTQRLFHFSIQTLIGSGTVEYENGSGLDKTSDQFFVVQPGANLNLNVTRWFRLSGGAYFRYAGNVNLEGTSDSDLSGVTTFFGLRFGKF